MIDLSGTCKERQLWNASWRDSLYDIMINIRGYTCCLLMTTCCLSQEPTPYPCPPRYRDLIKEISKHLPWAALAQPIPFPAFTARISTATRLSLLWRSSYISKIL